MSTWTVEQHGAVALLTFTSPPHNTIDFASMTELGDHLETIAAHHDQTDVVVLIGGLPGYFPARHQTG